MHLLEIKNLNYSVDGNTVLKNINLSVNSGDFLTIIGPSGAGKSTLLKIIASLLTPTSGSIEYEGKDISQYSPLEYRRQVSYCFQQPSLFGKTVRDNLIFPYQIRREEVNEEHLTELLDKVSLNQNFLKKNINSLSGGEKQRVALIRNLVFLPRILLLDEVPQDLMKIVKKLFIIYLMMCARSMLRSYK